MDTYEIYNMPALGRVGNLGSIYDARTEKFTKTSILNKISIDEVIISYDRPQTSCDYVSGDSYEIKFEKLNIKGALKLSLLSDSVEGSMKLDFLNNEKKTNKTVSTTLIYKVINKTETLALNDDKMKSYIADDLDCETDGTHFVTEIIWGGNAFVTFQLEINEKNNNMDFNADAKVSLTELSGVLKGLVDKNSSISCEIGVSSQIDKVLNKCKISIEGDLQIATIPKSIDDLVKLLNDIPNELRKFNDGKGVQIEYVLKPLEYIRKKFNKSIEISKFNLNIAKDSIKVVEDMSDKIRQIEGDYNDLSVNLELNGDIIGEEVKEAVVTAKQEFHSDVLRFRTELKNILLKVRKNEENESNFLKLINTYEINNWKIENKLSDFHIIIDKIEQAMEMKKAGFQYLERDVNNNFLLRYPDVFVFYSYNHDAKYISCVNALKRIKNMEEFSKCNFFIFDSEKHLNLRISYYVKSKLKYDGFDDNFDVLLIVILFNSIKFNFEIIYFLFLIETKKN
jgi:hypothetical protein